MLRAGLLAERPDEVMVGATGRPGIPVEVDGTSFATLGFHLGHGVDTVAIGDLAGRVLSQRQIAARWTRLRTCPRWLGCRPTCSARSRTCAARRRNGGTLARPCP